MTRHITDHRTASKGARMTHFLRLARAERGPWHRPHAAPGSSRLVHFLRIARGRLV